MNESVLFAIFFVWIAVIIYFLIKALFNCLRNKVVSNILQKGFDGRDTSKPVYKYICELILSHPTTGFDLSKACLTLELIFTNEKSAKTRLATINMNFKDAQISRTVCCQTDIRGFFMIIRHKPIPPITYIRAIHNCANDSKIFFEGFEIHDQMSGDRTFFAVKNNILNVEMKEAIVHIIKAQTLQFCSKQTFCPDFHSLNVESFGERIETPTKNPEETNGIRLLPKLDWLEEFVFNAYLVHLTFAFMAGTLFYLNDSNDFQKTIVSILFSGLLSPTVTQIISIAYRLVVKSKYNSNCSPMKVELNQSSNIWLIFRVFYLLTIFLLTILISLLAIVLIDENLKLEYTFISDTVERDAEILILLFVFTLIVIYTIWLTIFAVIRFLFRLMFFESKTVISDIETPIDKPNTPINTKGAYNQYLAKGRPPSPSERSGVSIEKSERSESLIGQKSKIQSKKKSKISGGNSDEELKNYSEMTKNNELNTGSVIVKPTKSLGYIDPKMFKLSESRIDINKPKDNSDKKN